MPPSPKSRPLIGHLHLLQPLLHHSFHKLSISLGPIFHLKLGSIPAIIISSPDLAKLFLKTHELTFANRFNTKAILHITSNFPFATAPYGPYWKLIKKLCMTEILGNKCLNRFIHLRRRETHRLVGKLKMKADRGEVVNVTDELLKMTNDIISEMMIGKTCSEAEAEQVRGLVREVTQIFGEFNVADFVWVFRKMDFLNGYRKRYEDVRCRFDAILEKIIKDKEEERMTKQNIDIKENDDDDDEEEEPKCFLNTLLDAMHDHHAEFQLTRNHIKTVILDFFTAATDTSSSSIEWALAELINNPNVMKEVRAEIDSTIGHERIVEESDGPNLPYMQALMKETYRLHPPIPLIIRRSFESAVVGHYNIPAGTVLFVNTWAMGRNPEYWAEPMEFRPNRFLEGTGKCFDLKGQDFELLPFGTGRRGCPGMMMALQELPMVIGALIQCFEWKNVAADGGCVDVVDMTERPGLTVPRKSDLLCVVKPRLENLDLMLE